MVLAVQSRVHSKDGAARAVPGPAEHPDHGDQLGDPDPHPATEVHDRPAGAGRHLPGHGRSGRISSSGAARARGADAHDEAVETLLANTDDAYGVPAVLAMERAITLRTKACTRARSRTSRSCAPGREPILESFLGRPAGHATHLPELRLGRHHPGAAAGASPVDATAADSRSSVEADRESCHDSRPSPRRGRRPTAGVWAARTQWRTGGVGRHAGCGARRAIGAFLRLWQLGSLGYNSDEAVYAGQGASLADDPALTPFFPIVPGPSAAVPDRCCRVGYHLGIERPVGAAARRPRFGHRHRRRRLPTRRASSTAAGPG